MHSFAQSGLAHDPRHLLIFINCTITAIHALLLPTLENPIPLSHRPTYDRNEDVIYNPPASSQRAAQLTGYKWSFASKLTNANNADAKALERAREDVMSATADDLTAAGGRTSGKKTIGPMLPPSRDTGDIDMEDDNDDGPGPASRAKPTKMSEADKQYERETQAERLALSRATRRPADRSEAEVHAGKEKMLENKRARRDGDKSFREGKDRDADGEIMSEDVLMGGGDSFRAQLSDDFF